MINFLSNNWIIFLTVSAAMYFVVSTFNYFAARKLFTSNNDEDALASFLGFYMYQIIFSILGIVSFWFSLIGLISSFVNMLH